MLREKLINKKLVMINILIGEVMKLFGSFISSQKKEFKIKLKNLSKLITR